MFAVTSSFFVQVYAPFAFHTGIPEIKSILGGYIIEGYLAPMVLLIKSLGLPLAVASGLSLGKVGVLFLTPSFTSLTSADMSPP